MSVPERGLDGLLPGLPVKKLVPVDRVTTASTCESEAYRTCAAYAEAAGRSWRGAVDDDDTLEGKGHA